jgi:hypothetical protein
MVQQADIVLSGRESFSLYRSGTGWIMRGVNVSVEPLRVDAWLRSVIETHGEDFVLDGPASVIGSISLRLGDGTMRVLEVGSNGEHGNWLAMVSGSPFVYVLSDWSFNRIFRDSSHFIRD